jgi:hypothetical protein
MEARRLNSNPFSKKTAKVVEKGVSNWRKGGIFVSVKTDKLNLSKKFVLNKHNNSYNFPNNKTVKTVKNTNSS